jgi:hypothetical protein
MGNARGRIFMFPGGSQMLTSYGGSVLACLTANYPDKTWPTEDSKEIVTAKGNYWRDISEQRRFLDEIAIKLKLKNLDEWYDVGPFKFTNVAGMILW